MSPTVYLVTGAGRGLGLEFVKQIAARSDTVVFAGIRSFPATGGLSELGAKYPGTVIPVKITSGDEADNAAAAKLIKERVGKVDIIIANAGINHEASTVANESVTQMRRQFETNTLGPLVLYQAFASLMGPGSKFVAITTIIGRISGSIPFSYIAYGASKAAANYITRKLDQEVPDLVAFCVHPGLVDTDMGRSASEGLGTSVTQLGGVSAAQSVEGVLKLVDEATKDSHGGRFWTFEGEEWDF